MSLVDYGIYFISDEFFFDFPDPYLKMNKDEKRPHYFCFKDAKTGLLWVIPFASKEEKIALAKKKIAEGKRDLFHLTHVGKDGVLLIQDSFPVTEKYIASEYTLGDIHYVFKDRSEIEAIHRKFSKILSLKRRGVTLTGTDPDVLAIERHLLAGTTMSQSKDLEKAVQQGMQNLRCSRTPIMDAQLPLS